MNTKPANQFVKGWIKFFVPNEGNEITLYTAPIRVVSNYHYNDVLCVVIGDFYFTSYPIRFLNSLPRNISELASARGYWMPERMEYLLKKINN